MSRAKLVAKFAFFGFCRGLSRFLPPNVLFFVLAPYGAVRAVRPALNAKFRHLPASRIPPPSQGDRPGFGKRWRYQFTLQMSWLSVLWYDRWNRPSWRERITSSGEAAFDDAANEGGLVVLTLHTSGLTLLGAWLGQRGLAIGSVLLPDEVPKAERYRNMMSEEDKARFGDSSGFARGDTRAMVRYMKPGRVMFLPADELRRYKTVDAVWNGGRIRLASGAFRMGRLTKSTVFPIIVTDAGRWRYHVHVGAPVPRAMIESGDDQAAANFAAQEIMPVLALRPEDAAPPLISACLQASLAATTMDEPGRAPEPEISSASAESAS